MSKRKWILLSTVAVELDLSPAEVRRLAEDDDLEARRDDATGPLLISRASIDDYLEDRPDDDDGDAVDADFDSGYDEGWSDAMAEKRRER